MMETGGFTLEVQSIVGSVLWSMGFTLDTVDEDVDEGGGMGSVVICRGPDCKIQIYYSSREGEVNAMIGPLDAPNKHGTYDDSGSGDISPISKYSPHCRWKSWSKSFVPNAQTSKPRRTGSNGLQRSASFVTSTRRVLWWSGGSSARLSVRLGSSSGDQSAAGEPWCSAHACRPSDARRSEYSCRRPRLISLHLLRARSTAI